MAMGKFARRVKRVFRRRIKRRRPLQDAGEQEFSSPHSLSPFNKTSPDGGALKALKISIGQNGGATSRLVNTIQSGHQPPETDVKQAKNLSPTPGADLAVEDLRYPGYLLRSGSVGQGVRTAQILLNQKRAQLDTDGLFGPLTLYAVVDFQRSCGLLMDGIIGPNTWSALIVGETAETDTPDDDFDYTSELQSLYAKLLEKNTDPKAIQQIIKKLFGNFPAPPAQLVNKTGIVSQNVAGPWDGNDVTGLQALLAQVEYYLTFYASGMTVGGVTYPLLGITELNLLLSSLQAGIPHPNMSKTYLPLLTLALADSQQKSFLISLVIFLNGAQGYRRLVAAMIKLKQQTPQQTQDLPERMAFVHRAMGYIGSIESNASSGDTAGATIGKVKYTDDNLNSPKTDNSNKPKTTTKYPLRKGYELFDRMWMEAVDVKFYSGNDRWGSVGQHADHIRILKQPKLPSWCGIYVTWIALQEKLINSKWKMGGGNVEYKHWGSTYGAGQIPTVGIDPGDILYAQNNAQHECIVISYDPQTQKITTIDGNTGPAASVTGGQILVKERRYDFFSHVRPFKGKAKSKPL